MKPCEAPHTPFNDRKTWILRPEIHLAWLAGWFLTSSFCNLVEIMLVSLISAGFHVQGNARYMVPVRNSCCNCKSLDWLEYEVWQHTCTQLILRLWHRCRVQVLVNFDSCCFIWMWYIPVDWTKHTQWHKEFYSFLQCNDIVSLISLCTAVRWWSCFNLVFSISFRWWPDPSRGGWTWFHVSQLNQRLP